MADVKRIRKLAREWRKRANEPITVIMVPSLPSGIPAARPSKDGAVLALELLMAETLEMIVETLK